MRDLRVVQTLLPQQDDLDMFHKAYFDRPIADWERSVNPPYLMSDNGHTLP